MSLAPGTVLGTGDSTAYAFDISRVRKDSVTEAAGRGRSEEIGG